MGAVAWVYCCSFCRQALKEQLCPSNIALVSQIDSQAPLPGVGSMGALLFLPVPSGVEELWGLISLQNDQQSCVDSFV